MIVALSGHSNGLIIQPLSFYSIQVLLLSCGLFLSPSYGPFGANPAEQQMEKPEEASQQQQTGSHLSRKVLEYNVPNSDVPEVAGYKMPAFTDVYDVPIVTSHEVTF